MATVFAERLIMFTTHQMVDQRYCTRPEVFALYSPTCTQHVHIKHNSEDAVVMLDQLSKRRSMEERNEQCSRKQQSRNVLVRIKIRVSTYNYLK